MSWICFSLALFLLTVQSSYARPRYFRTPEGRYQEAKFSLMQKEYEDKINDDVGSIKFTGNEVCRKEASVKLFCRDRCQSEISTFPSGRLTIAGIHCPAFKVDRPGTRANQLHLTCRCRYKYSGKVLPARLETESFTWAEVESSFTAYLKELAGASSSPAPSVTGGGEESEETSGSTTFTEGSTSPEESSAATEGSSAKPAEESEASTMPTGASDVSSGGPSSEAPSAGSEAPSEGSEAPSAGSEAPSEGSEAPSAASAAPSTGSEAPSAGSEAPSAGSEAPSAGSEAPSAGSEAPSAASESPSAGSEAPSEASSASPTGPSSSPVESSATSAGSEMASTVSASDATAAATSPAGQ